MPMRIALLALLSFALPAAAQYPDKPLTFYAGYPPGGLVDVVTRLVAEGMKPKFPKGINVINNGNANQSTGVTKIIDHSGRPATVKYFKELFGITSSAQIICAYDPTNPSYDPNAPADIEIILGDAWVNKNPMPK